MQEQNFYEKSDDLVGKLFDLTEVKISEMNSAEQQALGAFCFGLINAYAMKNSVPVTDIQAAMISICINRFDYSPKIASQFCDFIIECTDQEYHPAVYAIIHRGLEGYHQFETPEKLKENVDGIISSIKKYTNR